MIADSYPIYLLVGVYYSDELNNIAEQKIVTATVGKQRYLGEDWMIWWMKTSEMMKTKADKRLVYVDQWKNIGSQPLASERSAIKDLYKFQQRNKSNKSIPAFIDNIFTWRDKLYLNLYAVKYLFKGNATDKR